jgi:hypothetical protein
MIQGLPRVGALETALSGATELVSDGGRAAGG